MANSTFELLDSEQLDILRRLMAERDVCARRIGVAVFELDTFKSTMNNKIQELIKREQEQVDEFVRAKGLDASKQWRVNLDTGEISEVK